MTILPSRIICDICDMTSYIQYIYVIRSDVGTVIVTRGLVVSLDTIVIGMRDADAVDDAVDETIDGKVSDVMGLMRRWGDSL